MSEDKPSENGHSDRKMFSRLPVVSMEPDNFTLVGFEKSELYQLDERILSIAKRLRANPDLARRIDDVMDLHEAFVKSLPFDRQGVKCEVCFRKEVTAFYKCEGCSKKYEGLPALTVSALFVDLGKNLERFEKIKAYRKEMATRVHRFSADFAWELYQAAVQFIPLDPNNPQKNKEACEALEKEISKRVEKSIEFIESILYRE